MTNEKFVIKPWQIYLAILFGTIVRFIFGLYTKPWLSSPDQIAWELTLTDAVQNGSISYKSLIHYPHEGGSFFISLISFCFRPFQNIMPSLSFAALLIDTGARFTQIKLSQRMFGPVATAWFAVWTILSIPLLIPWATVNFGLHALSSFLPFVFLYIVTTYKSKYPTAIISGIVAGLSISFSYNNIIFIPAFLMFIVLKKQNIKNKICSAAQFIFFVLILLIPHFIARSFFDNGFDWQQYPFYSIRGVFIESIFTSEHIWNFLYVWHHALPASVLLSSIEFISTHLQRDIIFCFFIIGFIFLFLKNNVEKKIIYFSCILVFIFLLVYSFSPFYADDIQDKSYLYYRHLAYILPLIVIILIHAFLNANKLSIYFLILWITICGLATTMNFFLTKSPVQPAYRAAGWVLVQKYGEDINKLTDLYNVSPDEQKNETMVGYGWGFASAILNGKNENDTMTIHQLVNIINQFPEDQQRLLVLGVHHAFRNEITPVLDKKLLLMFDNAKKIKL